jgi:serine/threonine protein phosphatase PrpC
MTPSLIEIGQAQAPRAGENESGDRCVYWQAEQRALVAVIDGVGHGREAAEAAAVAAEVLERNRDKPLDWLLELCHEKLVATRGAAITLTLFDGRDGTLRWVGAGNVAAMLLHTEPSGTTRKRELLVRGGVAGVNLPSTEVSSTELARGDLVVLATDGLRPAFMDRVDRFARPQPLAERLLAEYGTKRDDALVVVARLVGTLQ